MHLAFVCVLTIGRLFQSFFSRFQFMTIWKQFLNGKPLKYLVSIFFPPDFFSFQKAFQHQMKKRLKCRALLASNVADKKQDSNLG